MRPRFWTIVFLVVVGVLLVRKAVGTRLPKVTLSSNTGEQVSLGALGDKQIGILIYLSRVACQGHRDAALRSAAVYKALADNPRYLVRIVYGDDTEEAAEAFAKSYDVPILLDPGKKLARQLGFDDYGVLYWRPNGRIFGEAEGRGLEVGPGFVEWLDAQTR